MSYMHIENLYKAKEILLFKECYAMEKIHGTSAHVSWNDGRLGFFSGGESREKFCALFNAVELSANFQTLGHNKVIVYGEAYGGKCQGMKATYGDRLRFIAFEVLIGESWLNVPAADEVVKALGLDFVAWKMIPTELEVLDSVMLDDSEQAVRNGMGPGHKREGIVLRPPIEVKMNNGARIIAKHKREDFQETKTSRPLDADKLQVLEEAEAIANEWVTEIRLSHVLDAFPDAGMKQMGEIIKAMNVDIEREAAGEIVESKAARQAIGKRTAIMMKSRLKAKLAPPAGRGGYE